MGSFVNPDEKVEIAEEGVENPRVITIRAKMDYALTTRIQAAAHYRKSNNSKIIETDLGRSMVELLTQNILAWRGGDLEGVPCDPAHIRRLNPTDPFIKRVIDDIGERNKEPESPDPKSATTNGSMSNGAHDSTESQASSANPTPPLANGTSKSPLQSVITGHLSKSDDSIPIT